MPVKTGHTNAIVRSSIPFIGTAVLGVLSGHQFLDFLLVPLAVALPLIAWSTIQISRQAVSKESIDRKYTVIYGISLAVLAGGLCFYFTFDAGLSHGTEPTELFQKKCLFAFAVVFAYPLSDLMLWQYYLASGSETARRIKTGTMLMRLAASVIAVLLLVQIVGSPLHAALRFGHPNIARALIRFGPDVHKSDRYRSVPLGYAVNSVDLEMAQLLFEKGATLDENTAAIGLRRAVEVHNTDMLRLLLSKGAGPDSQYMGATPLLWACALKDIAAIKILLDSGADVNFKSRYPNMPYDGKSPLDIAQESGNSQMVELLLSHGKGQ